jgi:hypothetical protein
MDTPTDMDTTTQPFSQSLPTDRDKSRPTDMDKSRPTNMDTTTAQPSVPSAPQSSVPSAPLSSVQPVHADDACIQEREKNEALISKHTLLVLNQDKKSQVSFAPQSSVPSAPLSSVPPVRADDEWPQDGDEIPLRVCLSLYHHHITRLQKELESQKKKLKSQKKLHAKEKKHAQVRFQWLRDDLRAIKGVTTGTEGTTWWGRGVDKDDNDDNHNYVYHLNVSTLAIPSLKAILDYDYEDVLDNVLVKYGVVTNAQSHKTNVSQTLKNGFIMFDINSVPSQSIDSIQCIDGTVHRYAPGPSDEWKHHWMILPKQPYAYE